MATDYKTTLRTIVGSLVNEHSGTLSRDSLLLLPLFLLIFFLSSFSVIPDASAEYYPGYTLYCQNNSRSTYLINEDNQTVHSWSHNVNGSYTLYLRENGNLVRTGFVNNQTFGGGGGQGLVQELDWDGDLVWQFTYSSNDHYAHHDIELMPNGNVLMIAWEYKSTSEARQAGFQRNVPLWPDHIIEVEPEGSNSGNIIWEWHAWDHLIQDYDSNRDNYGVVGDHPELLDINMSGAGGMMGGDWMHVNGISFNPDLDQIVISSHNLNEIYVIDHSTTTEEAAGHTGGNSGMGGDILYRWGKPSNYDMNGNQVFYVVHCSVWIPSGCPGAGNIMAFNNREHQGTSMIVEIVPPVDEDGNYSREEGEPFGPEEPTWTFTEAGFYSQHLGACQRLPNGNTLICESTSGYMFEVDQEGETQWSYSRNHEVVRILRYGVEFPGVYRLNPIDPGVIALNELLVLNDTTATDPAGESDAWIEIYNNSDVEHPLNGFTMSTSEDEPLMWEFPDTSIVPYEYMIIWLDGDIEQDGLHANFELDAEGGMLCLFAPDQSIMDQMSYENSVTDMSYGRYPNGTGDFTDMYPTFAAENEWDDIGYGIDGALPSETMLSDCYPNPFNSTITIHYTLSNRDQARISIYNITGRQIITLVDAIREPGNYSAVWNGTNGSGMPVASGVYVLAFQCGETLESRQITLVK